MTALERVKQELGWEIKDYRMTSFGARGKVMYPPNPHAPVLLPTELEIAAFALCLRLAEENERLKKYARHKYGCAHMLHHECDCGFAGLKIGADNQ